MTTTEPTYALASDPTGRTFTPEEVTIACQMSSYLPTDFVAIPAQVAR